MEPQERREVTCVKVLPAGRGNWAKGINIPNAFAIDAGLKSGPVQIIDSGSGSWEAEMYWIPHLHNNKNTEVSGLPRFVGGWQQVAEAMKLGPNKAIRLTAISPTIIRVQLIPQNDLPASLVFGMDAEQQLVPKPRKNAQVMFKVVPASGAHDFAPKPCLYLAKEFVASARLPPGKIQIWHASGRSWPSSLSVHMLLNGWQAVAADLKLVAGEVLRITAIKRTGLLITQLTPGSAGATHQRGTGSRLATLAAESSAPAPLPALDQTLEAESQSPSRSSAWHTVKPPLPVPVVSSSDAPAVLDGAREEGGKKEAQSVVRRRAVTPVVLANSAPPGQHPVVLHVHRTGVSSKAPQAAKSAKAAKLATPAASANTVKAAKRKRESAVSTSKTTKAKTVKVPAVVKSKKSKAVPAGSVRAGEATAQSPTHAAYQDPFAASATREARLRTKVEAANSKLADLAKKSAESAAKAEEHKGQRRKWNSRKFELKAQLTGVRQQLTEANEQLAASGSLAEGVIQPSGSQDRVAAAEQENKQIRVELAACRVELANAVAMASRLATAAASTHGI